MRTGAVKNRNVPQLRVGRAALSKGEVIRIFSPLMGSRNVCVKEVSPHFVTVLILVGGPARYWVSEATFKIRDGRMWNDEGLEVMMTES